MTRGVSGRDVSVVLGPPAAIATIKENYLDVSLVYPLQRRPTGSTTISKLDDGHSVAAGVTGACLNSVALNGH